MKPVDCRHFFCSTPCPSAANRGRQVCNKLKGLSFSAARQFSKAAIGTCVARHHGMEAARFAQTSCSASAAICWGTNKAIGTTQASRGKSGGAGIDVETLRCLASLRAYQGPRQPRLRQSAPPGQPRSPAAPPRCPSRPCSTAHPRGPALGHSPIPTPAPPQASATLEGGMGQGKASQDHSPWAYTPRAPLLCNSLAGEERRDEFFIGPPACVCESVCVRARECVSVCGHGRHTGRAISGMLLSARNFCCAGVTATTTTNRQKKKQKRCGLQIVVLTMVFVLESRRLLPRVGLAHRFRLRI